jgi:hypothetical protein
VSEGANSHIWLLLMPIKAIDIIIRTPRTWLPAITSEDNRISREQQYRSETAKALFKLGT